MEAYSLPKRFSDPSELLDFSPAGFWDRHFPDLDHAAFHAKHIVNHGETL